MEKLNLNLTDDQRKELKNLIEGEAYNYLEDIESAKSDLKLLAESAKTTFKIEPVMFKKLAAINFKQSLEEERLKFDAVDILYSQIFKDNKDNDGE